MINIERRALYNLLRMNWLNDPEMEVESWQVEDYRTLAFEILFDRLRQKGFHLERTSFLSYADECDTPEMLTDSISEGEVSDAEEQDEVYLIIFELWRRLVTEKPCLSVFCDELDHLIYLHDQEELGHLERLQDALAELQVILDQHVDRGIKPLEAFESVTCGCANDVGAFLYDFIAEQIDVNNTIYAKDLLEAFSSYVKDKKWFSFLRARLLTLSNAAEANQQIKDLIKKYAKDKDLEFNMELLASMVQQGDRSLFYQLVKDTTPLLATEEDFQDILTFCSDFTHLLDDEIAEKKIEKIRKNRPLDNLEGFINKKDPGIVALRQIISNS
jgi:hypothetical protein